MLKKRWMIALFVLVLASLACSLVTGAKKTPSAQSVGGGAQATAVQSTDSPAATLAAAEATQPEAAATQPGGDDKNKKYNTEFPLPGDVSTFTDTGDGAINFQTGMSIKEALAFYREAFDKAGYKEREVNTSITDTVFSLVFDGHASGKAIVIQAVDLGNGNLNINIRFEDI